MNHRRHHNKMELAFKIFAIVGLVLIARGVLLGEIHITKRTLMFVGIFGAGAILL